MAWIFETHTVQAHLDSIKREFEQLWEEGRVLQWASRRTACFMYLGEDEEETKMYPPGEQDEAVVRYHLVLRDIKPVYKKKLGKELRAIAMLPLEKSDLELSVDDLVEMPEIGQVLSTSLPISTTASKTANNSISAGSFGVERNQADDEMTSTLDNEGMEVDAEEKTAEKKQEEDEHFAHEMPDSMLSSSIQKLAGEVIAPREKPQRLSSSKKSGRHVKTLNAVEFDELRLKLSGRAAILGNRKRQKAKARQQKLQIKELEAELARLKEIEAELVVYEQQSAESLRAELKMHKKEVADLSVQIAVAAKNEIGVMDILRHELRK
uniref:Uncharacterized protein n=2 Tax=Phytophthora ramorum TaxID=164328 RepID=H3GYQ3_PHYRM